MITFIKWYYQIQTRALVGNFFDMYRMVEGYFDISMMARHLWEPLYQDYTYKGRIIGFVIRCGRILLGLLVQLIILIGLGLLALIWTLLPVIVIIKIVYISITMW